MELNWVHGVALFVALFLVSLLHEGMRAVLSDLVVKRTWSALKAFWSALLGKDRELKAPSGGAPVEDQYLKTDVFKEHKDGEEKILSAILHGLDQNTRVVTAASMDISDRAKEIRETFNLIQLSQKEQREVFDGKIGELHDKVNATNQTLATMKGSNDQVVEIAKEFIKLKASGQ